MRSDFDDPDHYKIYEVRYQMKPHNIANRLRAARGSSRGYTDRIIV